jgi:hypothetical protein
LHPQSWDGAQRFDGGLAGGESLPPVLIGQIRADRYEYVMGMWIHRRFWLSLTEEFRLTFETRAKLGRIFYRGHGRPNF